MFDLQGHRGARGLWPENTLVGFARTMELGVSALELDCAVTRDAVVVVSHDPELNPDCTRDARGRFLATAGPPIFTLTYAQLQSYDVGRLRPGSAYAARFPQQQPVDDTVRIGSSPPSPWLGGLDPEHFGGSIVRLVKATGAGTWGPDYLDLDAPRIEQAHAQGLRVVPWTVNDPADMERLLAFNVDGMITDRPDVLRALLEKRGMAVA